MKLWIKDDHIVVTGEKGFYRSNDLQKRGYRGAGFFGGTFGQVKGGSVTVLETRKDADEFFKKTPITELARIKELESRIKKLEKSCK